MLSKTLAGSVVGAILLLFSSVASAAVITNISDSAEQVRPLLPGLIAPDVTLKDTQGQPVALKKLLANKPTVLVVYRGGWCPYCSKQLKNIQNIEQQIAEMGLQIIAVSPDSPAKLAQSTISSPTYQLLSDDQLALAQAMGLAFFLDDKTAKVYRNKLGVNFVGLDGEQKVALPVPAVFVLDTQGMVHFQYANPNYRVRLSEPLLLAAAKQVMNH
ncbi:peroxiredoxin-like family protein [Pseudoalteromonas ruthenica]|uniref:peroxiredoxin-like family protein n=1 Tax=Pseudoalteromonas ruthenica TaxID=151081 RepID=UPI0005FA8ED2|nr:peroxiredoxin-like family protein [Pseudoalteromonas ruthenica]TMO84397.1 AhpC/TSA family protein [Pseudoalteromonas ruthenica]TMO93255.1 AhpC/TSA family protein [Pseudoalteromonas ruthenica]TMO99369.1 AhpC/TSA family protein [Pseudoalteromonas ruthenica]TMP03549.1 AhpC/TSA family protein [Pseudoalteromonas ruthenica]TMP04855.1 AhpC/TSA family protein [Pseudoalteromonas ruthenica]